MTDKGAGAARPGGQGMWMVAVRGSSEKGEPREDGSPDEPQAGKMSPHGWTAS